MEQNTAKKLCVIGDPIGHSKSPLIQNAMIKALGLDYEYTAVRVAGADTARWLARAKAEGYAGFNATMPHKGNLVPLMDELDGDARWFGAVNTVALREGKAYGFNTDGVGFLAALREAGMDPAGQTVMVLGAGGAAKAVVPKLTEGGAEAVTVCNRTLERAAALCGGDPRLTPAGFDPATLGEIAGCCSLVVNCTSLGMSGTEGQFESFDFLDALPARSGVFDLIYSPPETELLRQAKGRGHRTANGLGMLVWQAVFALEHFVGRPIDRERAKTAAVEVLRENGL